MSSADPLPQGWEEVTDKSGRKYYYNKSSGKTSWSRPKATDAVANIAPAAASTSPKPSKESDPLPEDWSEKQDSNGKTYYYNKKTRETSWKRPPAAASSSPAPPNGAASKTPEEASTATNCDQADKLPEDWVEKKDPKGKVYYYNKKTRETSWKKPAAPKSAAATPDAQGDGLPEDWVEKKDPKGKTYFYNKKTKETSWKKPQTTAASASPPPVASAASTPAPGANSADPEQTNDELPPDWVEKVDPKKGKTYYYNKKPKETSWKKPHPLPKSATGTPDAPPSEDEGGLPADWVEKKDPKGKTYYYNKKTKETSWKKPVKPVAATPDADPGPLPDGWEEKKDPKGKTYFFNRKTRETSWKRPAASATTPAGTATSSPAAVPSATSTPPSQAAEELHPDWTEKKDPNGKTYYYNKKTRETSWKRPDPPATASRKSNKTGLSLAGVDLNKLSEEWEEKVDSQGRHYYFNKMTRETTWQRPAPKLTKDQIGSLLLNNEVVPENILTQHPDWHKKFDAKTGLVYYFNAKTRETRWLDTNTGETTRLLRMPDLEVSIFLFGGVLERLDQQQQHHHHQQQQQAVAGDQQILCFNGHHWLPTPIQLPCHLEGPFACPIVPGSGHHDRCFVFGTRKDTRLPTCLEVVPDSGVISRPEFSQAVVPGAGVAAAPHAIVVTGGFSNPAKTSVTPECFLLDTSHRTRHSLPPLLQGRASHTFALINLSTPGRILWFCYVCGGFDGKKKTKSVERYVLGEQSWETMSEMRHARSGHGSVVVDRAIYVFGGREGYTATSTGEYMHSQTDIWTDTSPMRQARCNFGIELVNSHYIFVAGGWSGKDWLSSVEVYDVRLDLWRDVVSLPDLISSPGAALLKIPADLTAAALSPSAGAGKENEEDDKNGKHHRQQQDPTKQGLSIGEGRTVDARTLGYDF